MFSKSGLTNWGASETKALLNGSNYYSYLLANYINYLSKLFHEECFYQI